MRIPALVGLLCARCTITSKPPSPELLSVEPGTCTAGVETAVSIAGRYFHPMIRGSLADPETAKVDSDFGLTLVADRSYPLADVQLLNHEELLATVPALVPPGVYRLELVDPRGRTASLTRGLEVERARPSVIGPPCTDAADCVHPCSLSQECDSGFCVYDKDADGDGHIDGACGGSDCDDSCGECWSGHSEDCDGLDNDCDTGTPDGSGDAGFGDACDGPDGDLCEEGVMECNGVALHCTDTTSTTAEIPGDELDQDCDGQELCYADADGDGFRSGSTTESLDLDCADAGEAVSSAALDCDDDPGMCGSACSPDVEESFESGNCTDTFDNDCDLFADGLAAQCQWHGDALYLQRMPMCLNGTLIAGRLTDFPVLVSITDPRLMSANADGFDILFANEDGTTELDYEREHWEQPTGTLIAWVRFPALTAGANKEFYIYFDKDSESVDQQRSTAVWDPDYRAVWHLGEVVTDEQSTGTHVDSTGSFDGGQLGNVTAIGQIGSGQEFDGTDDFIDLGTTTIVDGRSAFTISAWVKLNASAGASDHFSVFARRIGTPSDGSLVFKVGDYFPADDTQVVVATHDGVWHDHFADTPTGTGTWTHIVASYDGSGTVGHYFNGEADGTHPFVEPVAVAGLEQQIGAEAGDHHVDGIIDEVRVSSAVRSAAWIETTYNNQVDPSAFLDCP